MEAKQNRPLNEVDYTNFTIELISLPNQDSKLDYLNFISSYYETNKSLYKQLIINIENLITDLTNDFMQSPQFNNSKLEWVELIEQYERIYRNPNRGQFTVKDLKGLIELIYQYSNEVLEGQIDKHYWFLSHFVSIATRYKIEALYNLKTETNYYPIVGDGVEYCIESFQRFQRELKNKLEKQENWKVIEIDIEHRFLPMIHKYYEWYEINKEETKKFEPANFYEWMYEVMRSTEKEINKWFKPGQPAADESLNIEGVEEKNGIDIINNFDLINIKTVYAYFKEKLVEKRYLSDEDLFLYLKAAFEQQIVPETKFVIKDATKGKANNVFYEYFKNIAGKPTGKQKDYAALLGKYFEGYETNNVSTNWSK